MRNVNLDLPPALHPSTVVIEAKRLSYGEDPVSPQPEIAAQVSEQPAAEIDGGAVQAGENPAWGIREVVRIAVVAIIAIALLSTVALGLALRFAAPGRLSPADLARNARVVVPAQFVAYVVVIAYMIWLVRRRGRPFWAAIGWRWPQATWFGWMALGVALALLVQSASALLPIPKSLPIDRYFRDALGAYMMAAFGLTFAPLVEELFFRGFLYPAVARRWGLAAGVVVTSALFASIHASQLARAWGPLLLLFFVGVVLTLVRARTHSVATTLLIHVGYNGTLFGMLYLASDHFRHFERLS
jgi:membrane protease YdiL (CAAX protease family)